jgi:hypothetical protein
LYFALAFTSFLCPNLSYLKHSLSLYPSFAFEPIHAAYATVFSFKIEQKKDSRLAERNFLPSLFYLKKRKKVACLWDRLPS